MVKLSTTWKLLSRKFFHHCFTGTFFFTHLLTLLKSTLLDNLLPQCLTNLGLNTIWQLRQVTGKLTWEALSSPRHVRPQLRCSRSMQPKSKLRPLMKRQSNKTSTMPPTLSIQTWPMWPPVHPKLLNSGHLSVTAKMPTSPLLQEWVKNMRVMGTTQHFLSNPFEIMSDNGQDQVSTSDFSPPVQK